MKSEVQPSAAVAFWESYFRQQEYKLILDYGAGKLRNSLFLSMAGFDVVAADTAEMVAKIKPSMAFPLVPVDRLAPAQTRFDAVVCSYVLNILDDCSRGEALRQMVGLLRQGGTLCVEIWRRSGCRFRVEGELLQNPVLRPVALLVGPSYWSGLFVRQ